MQFKLAFAAVAVAAVAFGATAVLAQQNPIEQRQALMKENGKQARAGAAMAKGEAPFDLAKAKAIFAAYENSGNKAQDLFPPDSKTGNDTTAAPKIWESMADFKAKLVKFAADSKAAQDSVKDLDSFKTAFAAMGRQCGACHQDYRIKKN